MNCILVNTIFCFLSEQARLRLQWATPAIFLIWGIYALLFKRETISIRLSIFFIALGLFLAIACIFLGS